MFILLVILLVEFFHDATRCKYLYSHKIQMLDEFNNERNVRHKFRLFGHYNKYPAAIHGADSVVCALENATHFENTGIYNEHWRWCRPPDFFPFVFLAGVITCIVWDGRLLLTVAITVAGQLRENWFFSPQTQTFTCMHMSVSVCVHLE